MSSSRSFFSQHDSAVRAQKVLLEELLEVLAGCDVPVPQKVFREPGNLEVGIELHGLFDDLDIQDARSAEFQAFEAMPVEESLESFHGKHVQTVRREDVFGLVPERLKVKSGDKNVGHETEAVLLQQAMDLFEKRLDVRRPVGDFERRHDVGRSVEEGFFERTAGDIDLALKRFIIEGQIGIEQRFFSEELGFGHGLDVPVLVRVDVDEVRAAGQVFPRRVRDPFEPGFDDLFPALVPGHFGKLFAPERPRRRMTVVMFQNVIVRPGRDEQRPATGTFHVP